MRLFHVSEEGNIEKFIPRIPTRPDMDKAKGLVWSLTEPPLPYWLSPRDCPRVGYRIVESSTQEDIERFFSSPTTHCLAIEHGWHKRMAETTLYVYEFNPTNFYYDETAQFYVSDKTEIPIGVTKHDDLYEEAFKRNTEIRLVNNLWKLAEAVKQSSLQFSLCRMANALPNLV